MNTNTGLTYRQLLKNLSSMSDERLDDHALIYRSDFDEFYEVKAVHVAIDDDHNEAAGVLDDGHFYMVDKSI